jgi:hypothetical protein
MREHRRDKACLPVTDVLNYQGLLMSHPHAKRYGRSLTASHNQLVA